VTHNWGNLFRDLVAAICADALGEDEYSSISHILMNNPSNLEDWIYARGAHLRTYWVCAFSVNQHAAICGGNPYNDTDPVLLEIHPTCPCGLTKHFSGLGCEMNKFDVMMSYLSATDSNFAQVVAIDFQFVLFSRAWCVSEIAAANTAGMIQSLKIHSSWSLAQKAETLRLLKIEDMEASRPEDKAEILATIADTAAFDAHVQHMLFEELIPAWGNTDDMEQMNRIGSNARWIAYAETFGADGEAMLRISTFEKEEATA